jgi:hypothetical protein
MDEVMSIERLFLPRTPLVDGDDIRKETLPRIVGQARVN